MAAKDSVNSEEDHELRRHGQEAGVATIVCR